MVEGIHEAVFIQVKGRFAYTNPAATELFGADSIEQMIGSPVIDRFHPDFHEIVRARISGLNERREAMPPLEERLVRFDGSVIDAELSGVPFTFQGEAGALVFARNITERKEAERRHHALSATLTAAIGSMTDAVFISDTAGHLVMVNDAFATFHKFRDKSECAATLEEYPAILDVKFPDGSPAPLSEWAAPRALRGEVATNAEYHLRRKDTGETWIGSYNFAPIRSPDGTIIGSVVVGRDITDQKRAEAALHESEIRFSTIFKSGPAAIAITSSQDQRILDVNEAWLEIFGYNREEVLGRTAAELNLWNSKNRENLVRDLDTTRGVQHFAISARRKDGEILDLLGTAERLDLNEEPCFIGMMIDVTRMKQAERAKAELEMQLLHAQKMESMGRLAGGIAHDFNNILMVQRGYTELLRTRIQTGKTEPSALMEKLGQIDAATDRAAALTRQLLAFSRKQGQHAVRLDLNVLVKNINSMLNRLIGEPVVLHVFPAKTAAIVEADPGQVEQIIVNLVVNARDAMPNGGSITIEIGLEDLDGPAADRLLMAPGPCVVLSVSDTGCGMDAQTRAHMFEPCFTTKEEGKGTGLGLSTVYSIVHQSHGGIALESEPQKGTQFHIYLPRVDGSAQQTIIADPELLPGKGELILVVEDDPALRKLTLRLLETMGYNVLSAGTSGEALIQVEMENIRPDVLLTDIALPGLAADGLVHRLRRTIPDLRVIYMSGAIDPELPPSAGDRPFYLQKPFSKCQLSAVLRGILDSSVPAS